MSTRQSIATSAIPAPPTWAEEMHQRPGLVVDDPWDNEDRVVEHWEGPTIEDCRTRAGYYCFDDDEETLVEFTGDEEGIYDLLDGLTEDATNFTEYIFERGATPELTDDEGYSFNGEDEASEDEEQGPLPIVAAVNGEPLVIVDDVLVRAGSRKRTRAELDEEDESLHPVSWDTDSANDPAGPRKRTRAELDEEDESPHPVPWDTDSINDPARPRKRTRAELDEESESFHPVPWDTDSTNDPARPQKRTRAVLDEENESFHPVPWGPDSTIDPDMQADARLTKRQRRHDTREAIKRATLTIDLLELLADDFGYEYLYPSRREGNARGEDHLSLCDAPTRPSSPWPGQQQHVLEEGI